MAFVQAVKSLLQPFGSPLVALGKLTYIPRRDIGAEIQFGKREGTALKVISDAAFVAPTSQVSSDAKLSTGASVWFNSKVGSKAVLGDGACVLDGAIVEDGATVGGE